MIVLIPRLSIVHEADVFDGLAAIAERKGLQAEVDGLGEYRPRSRCEHTLCGTVHYRVRLRLFPVTDRYRLLGRHGRRIRAVCWHGHRDVMRELFDIWPRATLISALAIYRGADDFDVSHHSTQQAYCDGDAEGPPMRSCDCMKDEWYGSVDSATWTPDLLDEQQ
ncbi:hypothetical protein [Actinocatenispora comari]|uniref:Uncharacterized protein n=1 Tax=Actinocatenispora comari TaxID=2807577 RepID=A0A8J4ELD6_9ACTN|nr:hypothetical protein [Actinocatenispora comari]GIL25494.1 hypothetical protein NUM_07490 [Actinocatenispora comari]